MRRRSRLVTTFLALLLSSCAIVRPAQETSDPWEGWNRRVFAFNDAIDRRVMKPVSEGYLKVVPSPIRTVVTNFFDNLMYINVFLNSYLQGKGKQGYADMGRFLINSTLGLGGLIDIASDLGIPKNEEDFGQTLAVWGFGEGPYLVLPLLGPSSFRDAPGYAFSAFTHPLTYYGGDQIVSASLGALSVVDQRARVKGVFELINAAALDRYIFIREAYRQRRIFLIYDGHPPFDLLDDAALAPPRPESEERR
jgi:phospholipid-binding lipoprotein MlaA